MARSFAFRVGLARVGRIDSESPFSSDPGLPNLAAVFCFVLGEMFDDPLRCHLVVPAGPQGSEVFQRHPVSTSSNARRVTDNRSTCTGILGGKDDEVRRIPQCPPKIAEHLPYPTLMEESMKSQSTSITAM